MGEISILGIVGSQRQGSYNRFALQAARELAPEGAAIELVELHDIPFFEHRNKRLPPPAVVELKRRVWAADAILFATPECQHAVPGKLKSAIDWAARPPGDCVWRGKPAAVISASAGDLVTGHAQNHLQQLLGRFAMPTVDLPGGINGHAELRFALDGQLVDAPTRQFITDLVTALVSLVRSEWAARGFNIRERA